MSVDTKAGHPETAGPADPTPWRRLLLSFAVAFALVFGLIAGFVTLFDPYGVGPLARPGAPVLMDMNQRYMYPQIIRSGRFDSAVIGTSTMRLLDPLRLDSLLGGHFANLAMNSATPWEQTQVADLFFRHDSPVRSLVVGLDHQWCDPDGTAPEKRVTFRGFPQSFYDENPWNDWPELLNLKTIEIAWRLALHRAGLMPTRYRNDGYEVFTPPEETYDLARAQGHIWEGHAERRIVPVDPPDVPSEAERAGWRFPALAWIDDLAGRLPQNGRLLLVFPPSHVAVQPAPGSRLAFRMQACKEAAAALARRHGGLLVDFAIPSAITRGDSHFWDNIHYRLPVADEVARDLAQAWATGADAADGTYRVLAAPPPRS